MKTAENKTTAARSAQTQEQTQQPFFRKDGQGDFFSEKSQGGEPFFGFQTIQPKLTIGKPGDKYEQEADAVADKVVQRLSATPTNAPATNPNLQRSAEEREEENVQLKPVETLVQERVQRKAIFESNEPEAAVQTKPAGSPPIQAKCAACEAEEKKLQKMEEQGEEEPLQGKIQRKCAACGGEDEPDLQPKSETLAPYSAGPDLQSRLSSSKGGGMPLPADTRGPMEDAIGADFSGVRIHTGSSAVQMNKELNAQAFTHGSDIYFGAGKYDTGSGDGKRLLAHELVHTVQQGGGGVVAKKSIVQKVAEPDAAEQDEGAAVGAEPASADSASTTSENDGNRIPDGTPVNEQEDPCPQLVPPYPTGQEPAAPENAPVFEEIFSMAATQSILGPLGGLITRAGQSAWWAWRNLPDAIKARVINMLLDRAIQGAFLMRKYSGFLGGGFMMTLMNSAMIGFFQTLKALPDKRKIAIFDKMAKIIVGADLKFLWGYLKGLVIGFFMDGLVGIIQMVIDIVCFIPKIINFFRSVTNFLQMVPQELLGLVMSSFSLMKSMSSLLIKGPIELAQIIMNPMRAIAIINAISQAAQKGAEKIGQAMANALIRFYSMPSGAMGEIVGRIGGQIIFEVVLAVVTSGGGAALTGAKTVFRYVAKFFAKLGKYIFGVIKFIGRVLRQVGAALRSVGKFLTRTFKLVAEKAGAVIDGVLDLFRKFGKYCRPGSIWCSWVNPILTRARTYNRGSRQFQLVQGNATSGWKHIFDRHIDPTRFPGKSKFHTKLDEDDISDLLKRTIKHGKESEYEGLPVFTFRTNIKGVGYKKYRATANLDGTIRSFHPLD